MNLYNHQKDFLAKGKDIATLAFDTGCGKTLTAVHWLDTTPALVITPKQLKTDWLLQGTHATVLTKEEFKKVHKTLPEHKQIIVDETHVGFLSKSQCHHSLMWYMTRHNVPRRLFLTATPLTSTPWSLYYLARLMGIIFDYKKFESAFFFRMQIGRRTITSKKNNKQKELADLVSKLCEVAHIQDLIDVPPQVHEIRYIGLTEKQKKAQEGIYDPLPIVRYGKQHQTEQGFLLGNEFEALTVLDTDKTEVLKDIVRDNTKVAIVCKFREQIRQLKVLFPKALEIHGDVKDRHAVCVEAEEAERCVLLIQGDVAYGFELPSFMVCVFASMSYNRANYDQTLGRFLRINKPTPTTFIYLLTEGESVDKAIYDTVVTKGQDFKLELYEKTRSSVPN